MLYQTFPLGIYRLCMYLYALHIHGKQSIQCDGVCISTCLSIDRFSTTDYTCTQHLCMLILSGTSIFLAEVQSGVDGVHTLLCMK